MSHWDVLGLGSGVWGKYIIIRAKICCFPLFPLQSRSFKPVSIYALGPCLAWSKSGFSAFSSPERGDNIYIYIMYVLNVVNWDILMSFRISLFISAQAGLGSRNRGDCRSTQDTSDTVRSGWLVSQRRFETFEQRAGFFLRSRHSCKQSKQRKRRPGEPSNVPSYFKSVGTCLLKLWQWLWH